MNIQFLQKYGRLLLQVGVFIAIIANSYILYSISQPSSNSSDKNLFVTVLTAPECEDCFDFAEMIDYYKEQGVTDGQIEYVEYDSRAGKKLVNKFSVNTVPTVLVEGDIQQYSYLQELVGTLATVKEDTLVLNDGVQPPYLEIETGEKRGAFEVIYLSDTTCEDCYDVDLHRPVFDRLIMTADKETILDSADDEAVTLIEEYAITAIPTIILRGDLAVYKPFNDIWESAGTIEEDGTYILRQGVLSMGTYKSLPTGEIIEQEDPSVE